MQSSNSYLSSATDILHFAPINTAMITGGAGTRLQTRAACVHLHASPLQLVNCTHIVNEVMEYDDARVDQLYLSDEGEEDQTRPGHQSMVLKVVLLLI